MFLLFTCMLSQANQLQWDFYGVLCETRVNLKRKFVGSSIHQRNRRDFVRMVGSENNTCLSAELFMFVKLSGFVDIPSDAGIFLPESCRNETTNTSSVVFALVRWLSPHPDALIRDSKLRPLCPPPLDINHALWTYARSRRNSLSVRVINNHIMLYEGDTREAREKSVRSERDAFFDLVQPHSFDRFINCTLINTEIDTNTILETITLPFEQTDLDLA